MLSCKGAKITVTPREETLFTTEGFQVQGEDRTEPLPRGHSELRAEGQEWLA